MYNPIAAYKSILTDNTGHISILNSAETLSELKNITQCYIPPGGRVWFAAYDEDDEFLGEVDEVSGELKSRAC